MKRISGYLFIFICGGSFCFGQQAVSTAGGEAAGSGGSVSYTVGQTEYVSSAGSDGVVSPGIQQPYEIFTVTGIVPETDITFKAVVYPNPATDMLTLKIQWDKPDKLKYTLIDIKGKILDERVIENNETAISLQNYPPSTYFLQVKYQMQIIKVFKIIKN